ncbi:hypothetical protein B9Z19DRAFT_1101034 [Tuber borchii]|uniref:Uncharacterized protein n=1 Tax=Tuber borchii TaxID=42251 RepID=A0A2T6ZUA2_TUBBO|nr:hypothetical protein B9Z19DRAFT_1101034 [Tuber borchii]
MGNLCGKESGSSLPNGRVLGSGAQPAGAGRIPLTNKSPKIASGPGRTLGGEGSGEGGSTETGAAAGEQLDPRTAAALAAEERLKRNAGTGKLGSELDKQKRKTQNQHIQDLGKTKRQQEQLVWD